MELKEYDGRRQVLFQESEKEIRELCSYYSRHREKKEYKMSCYDGDTFFVSGKLSDETMKPQIKKILKTTPFEDVAIWIDPQYVRLDVDSPYAIDSVVFKFDSYKPRRLGSARRVAPHWWNGERVSKI